MTPKKCEPVHPGEILLKDFIIPCSLSQYRLAKDIGVSAIRVSEIVRGKRSITADTALRLAKYFKTSPQLWLNLQMSYDLAIQEALMTSILKEVRVFDMASS